jgi:hypothetical protein
MKLIRAVIIFMCLAHGAGFAQNKQVLYDFVEVPQALMLNPGMQTDFKWYAGIPLVSGISAYAGSNGIAVNDIFANDGLDINVKVRERMLNGMTIRDEFSANQQIEWFSGGFRGRDPNVFYSFGAYLEVDNIVFWPSDYAFLIMDGNVGQLNRRFDLDHLKARGAMVNVVHFGLNKKIGKRLTVGGRAKYYAGLADYNTTQNKGYLVNTLGQNNILATTLSADMKLRTSGFNELSNADEGAGLGSTLLKRTFFGGDIGLGVDLGFSYALTEQTVITGSILDFGFIYHSGDVETYTLKGNATVEGIEIDILEDFANLNRDFWQDLVDDVEELVPFEEKNNPYITFRPTKVYGSLRHGFGKPIGATALDCDCTLTGDVGNNRMLRYRNEVGGQLFLINRPRGPQAAITGFYLRRFGNLLALKATYTADKFSYTNIGLGINLQAGPVNFYAMADNLLSYQNIAGSHYASFQFGLNIISWGRK